MQLGAYVMISLYEEHWIHYSSILAHTSDPCPPSFYPILSYPILSYVISSFPSIVPSLHQSPHPSVRSSPYPPSSPEFIIEASGVVSSLPVAQTYLFLALCERASGHRLQILLCANFPFRLPIPRKLKLGIMKDSVELVRFRVYATKFPWGKRYSSIYRVAILWGLMDPLGLGKRGWDQSANWWNRVLLLLRGRAG